METRFSILGDHLFHRQLCLATEVLAHYIRSQPKELSVEQVSMYICHPRRSVHALCRKMARAGLLVKDPNTRNTWGLPSNWSSLTLSDVYEFVAAERATALSGTPNGELETLASNIAIHWMQAALATNQSVATQLRQFSVDKIVHCSKIPFPASPARVNSWSENEDLNVLES